MAPTGSRNAPWYRSFDFRIGASFVVFVVAIVVAQSAIFSHMVRSGSGLGPRPPNILAAIVAADVLFHVPRVRGRLRPTREWVCCARCNIAGQTP